MRKGLFYGLAIVIAAVLVFAACSDDAAPNRFEVVDATTPPTAEASLPPPAPDAEAGIVDAGEDVAFVPPAVACDASPCVVRLVGGQTHYCAVLDDGTVRCWGDPALLGGGVSDGGDSGAVIPPDAGPGPQVVPGVTAVSDLVVTTDRTCATHTDGGVDCWGAHEPAPTRVSGGAVATYIPSGTQGDGSNLSCTIASSGALTCAGNNYLIDETYEDATLSFDLDGHAAAQVAFNPPTDRQYGMSSVGFVLDANHALRSWGFDTQLLGRETPLYFDYSAAPVTGLPDIRGFSTAGDHACAVSTTGHLFCWGVAGNATLGLGYLGDERIPVEVAFPERWPHQVAANNSHSCAAMTKGTVYCWGGVNYYGERGQQAQDTPYVPVKADATPEDVVAVAVADQSTCALVKSGRVWCWGANYAGQLGRGTRDTDRHPMPAPILFP